jgi:hypothetical protein
MSYSKIASLVMYIVVGISVITMIIFYFGNSFVDKAEFSSKVAKIENPSGKSSIPGMAQDLKSADSLAVKDSTAAAQGQSTMVENAEPVSLTFLEKLAYNQTDIPLMWGYILLLIAMITAVTFPIIYMFKHPTNLLRSLIILVIVAVFVGLAYSVASGTPYDIPGYTGGVNQNPQILRIIDTGLIFMYFILGISLLSVLYSEIANSFK